MIYNPLIKLQLKGVPNLTRRETEKERENQTHTLFHIHRHTAILYINLFRFVSTIYLRTKIN